MSEQVENQENQTAAPAAQVSGEQSMQQQLSGRKETAKPAAVEAVKQPKRVRKLGDLFTGRRKTSVARVKLVKGSGQIVVNSKPIEQYFPRIDLQALVKKPLLLTETHAAYDISVNVKGGGITGQAGAVSLGIARALDQIEPQHHAELRKAALLTRDSRAVERKKYGLHKARRATQFSKR